MHTWQEHLSRKKSEDKGIEIVAFKATKSLSWPTIPALYLHHELGVSLCTCDNHIHPDPHGLRRGSDHVVDSVMSLYTEGQGGIWALKERWNGDLKSGDSKNKNIFLWKGWDITPWDMYTHVNIPYVHFLSDHNTLLQSLGSKWLLSAWLHAYLQKTGQDL